MNNSGQLCVTECDTNSTDSASLSATYPTSENVSSFNNTSDIGDDVSVDCYQCSSYFIVILCLVNIVILVVGLVGNLVVIYVVIHKLPRKTSSSVFILNLAAADLLVILCCIPTTIVANLFTPWVFSNYTCKVAAFAKGLFMFCSVYSLVAISFDRCRAMKPSTASTAKTTPKTAHNIVLSVWLLGAIITIPWVIVFQAVDVPPDKRNVPILSVPFCEEVWPSKTLEAVYFMVVHGLICYLIPLIIITVCNLLIWKTKLDVSSRVEERSPTQSEIISLGQRVRQQKRVLKTFTALNFSFFLLWLPLYLIMARMKFAWGNNHSCIVYVIIPLAQLLAKFNSCLNPLLYAFLSKKFRKAFLTVWNWPLGLLLRSSFIASLFGHANDSEQGHPEEDTSIL